MVANRSTIAGAAGRGAGALGFPSAALLTGDALAQAPEEWAFGDLDAGFKEAAVVLET
jgi:hypothetical protein